MEATDKKTYSVQGILIAAGLRHISHNDVPGSVPARDLCCIP